MSSRFARLSSSDLSNLRLESSDTPAHVAVVAILDGAVLLDDTGRLRLEHIRQRLDARLVRVPELRRRLHRGGPFGGRPVWVDDEDFDIASHVQAARLDPPGALGDERRLLEWTADLLRALLDRAHPLWQIWLVTGLDGERVAMVLKIHHVIADGLGMVAILGALFDTAADVADPDFVPWAPAPLPTRRALVLDNLASKAATARKLLRHLRRSRSVAVGLRRRGRSFAQAVGWRSSAPRTSLNAPVHAGRRVRFFRADLAEVKARAHAAEGKVNDVVLDVVAAGLRALLVSRHERVEGVSLRVTVPVSLRKARSAEDARALGNRVGGVVIPLPLDDESEALRLEKIVASTRAARAEQSAAFLQRFMAWLAATPIAPAFIRHQRFVNAFVTNVAGPPAPMFVLGARIVHAFPVVMPMGNVGAAFSAFSYAGELTIAVTADASRFPDVDVLAAGMERGWASLRAGLRPVQ